LSAAANEIYIYGNYAYIASSRDNQELQVAEISDPANPSMAGSYNLSDIHDSLSIIGFNNTILVGRSNGEVAIFDVSTLNSPILSGTYNGFSEAINDISLGNDNNYAFLASNADNAEFQVIDISTPANPASIGFLDISGDLNGVAYHGDKDRAFAVGENNSKELTVIAPQ